MKYFVDHGADVNAKGFNIKQDKKLLIYASENNPFEILKYPFGNGYDGADVNVKEYLNRTLTINDCFLQRSFRKSKIFS